jgi:argininosuccinate synthase
MDGKVRSLRDQFVTHSWSEILYNGLYFSPEREFVENSLIFSQKRVVCANIHEALGRLILLMIVERRGPTSLLPW